MASVVLCGFFGMYAVTSLDCVELAQLSIKIDYELECTNEERIGNLLKKFLCQ